MKRKLKITLYIALGLAIILGYDYYRMQQIEFEVISIQPDPAEADPRQPVVIELAVTDKRGNPVRAHNIVALSLSGGSWNGYRQKTDENGRVTFSYNPFKLESYQTARDVVVKFRDESNSVFVEMYPTLEVKLRMVPPTERDTEGLKVDDLFS